MRTGPVLTGLAALALLAQPLTAQGRFGGPRGQLLRDAARLESEGDLEGAEEALRSLLASDPRSTGVLFALERVLRAQGRLEDVLPLLDGFLERQDDPEVRALELRVLAESGSTEALVAKAERWIAEAPMEESTYRAVADAYRVAFGPERGLMVLRRGRSEIGERAFALEIGDLLAAEGDLERAVEEWALAVGATGSDAQLVRGRVEDLPEGREAAARRLVGILGDSEAALQRGAAARIAIELGLLPEALELSRQYAEGLQGRAKASFLEDVGRMANMSELGSVAAWAYEELREAATGPAERRQFDLRIVDSALEAGDTARALTAQRRVAASFPPGSEEARAATARVVRLQVGHADPDQLRLSFLSFQASYPDAPELDDLAAATSAALRAAGDVEGAEAVLAGMDGPRSTLERAYMALEAGALEEGRPLLLRAVSGLPPAEATPVIQLTNLLGRLSSAGTEALIAARAEARLGRGSEAARALAEQLPGLPRGDRPALLAEAARMADRGGAPELGASLRERILEQHPDAPEVGEASLALARHHARPGGDPSEAVRLLEELIVSDPDAAVVPDARLELERLRGRGS